MKRILVPCDFSRPAINAYRFALKIAARSGRSVHLIYVIELPVLHDTMLMPVLSIEQDYIDDLRIKAEKSFSKLLKRYKTGGVKVKTEVVFGAVITMITDQVKAKKIDAIIMGSHGASGMKEIFIGSNAEKIVRKATVPVFILKDLYDDNIERIVFPYTPETDDQKAYVAKIVDLQKFFQADLHIVWINSPNVFHRDIDILKRLRDFAKRYRLKDFSIHVFNDLNERDGIINFADTVNADLIAMGTRGARGITHLLTGSITEDVVNRVKWPIWTYVVK